MKLYSADVRVYATVYVKADTEEEAIAKVEGMDCTCVALTSGEVEVSEEQYTSPDLPEISLSPVATLRLDGKPEVELAHEYPEPA